MTASTHAHVHAETGMFNTSIRLDRSWADPMANATVAQVLNSLAISGDRHFPIVMQGEFAEKSNWLNILTRSIRLERQLPASFVISTLIAAGMPLPNMTASNVSSMPTISDLPVELFDY